MYRYLLYIIAFQIQLKTISQIASQHVLMNDENVCRESTYYRGC